MSTLTVVIAEPGKPAELRTVTNDLETIQAIVGGYIEQAPPSFDVAPGCALLLNEEGRLRGLPPNRRAMTGETLVGTIVVVGRGGSDWRSLSPDEAAAVKATLDAARVSPPN